MSSGHAAGSTGALRTAGTPVAAVIKAVAAAPFTALGTASTLAAGQRTTLAAKRWRITADVERTAPCAAAARNDNAIIEGGPGPHIGRTSTAGADQIRAGNLADTGFGTTVEPAGRSRPIAADVND
jgi:hypothetical protein